MKISSEDLSKGNILDKMKDKTCEEEKRTKNSALGCKGLKGESSSGKCIYNSFHLTFKKSLAFYLGKQILFQ